MHPPCFRMLYQHILSIQFIASLWKNNTNLPSPLDFGWEMNIKWVEGEQYPANIDLTTVDNIDITAVDNIDITTVDNIDITTVDNIDITTVDNIDLTTVDNIDITTVDNIDITTVDNAAADDGNNDDDLEQYASDVDENADNDDNEDDFNNFIY